MLYGHLLSPYIINNLTKDQNLKDIKCDLMIINAKNCYDKWGLYYWETCY